MSLTMYIAVKWLYELSMREPSLWDRPREQRHDASMADMLIYLKGLRPPEPDWEAFGSYGWTVRPCSVSKNSPGKMEIPLVCTV